MENRDNEEYLKKIINNILDERDYVVIQSRKKWDSLAKPLHGLGQFEDIVSGMAGLRGSTGVRIDKRTLLVFCSDNGVVREGVSQSDAEVTARVAMSIAKGKSTVNNLAKNCSVDIIAVDVGIRDEHLIEEEKDLNKILKGKKKILDRNIKRGTENILYSPAMTREECIKAITDAIDLVKELKKNGTKIILTGEMGIGNTTTSAAIASILLDEDPEVMTGRGAGLGNEGLIRKKEVIMEAINKHRPDKSDPVDVISKTGGLDIAALCGVYLGCAYHRIPVLIDGFVCLVAALCAIRLSEKCINAMIPSHLSSEPGAVRIVKELGLNPVINADMHLGEGTGAVMMLSLLDASLNVYNSSHSFSKLGIAPYTEHDPK
ncbi:MAG: nicotinate-nucleotide--dimethylbenzimidazole phosphoribosyltransferase [Lachnospiraceae bacterium]|nr:nicotinate-nucleotide--dimethylbenzimidazole phosphoribosyltransferase [Lachnospiraceae bacterium]